MTSTSRSAVALRDSLSLSLRPPLLGRRQEDSSKTFSGPKIQDISWGVSPRSARERTRSRSEIGLAPSHAAPPCPRSLAPPRGRFFPSACRPSPPAVILFPPPRVVRFLRPSSVPPPRAVPPPFASIPLVISSLIASISSVLLRESHGGRRRRLMLVSSRFR